ncbi:MAG: hypothetical protein HYW86_00390 [Candidatus Roizmanbacteria bacterium]|nr:MAG: hypothetical protein HYW86_00390 [Candidatus Roizmanbacteria bacterium]
MPTINYTPIDDIIANGGYSSKEKEPAMVKSEPLEIHEIVEHKEVDEEVKPHIEVKQENVKLPEDLTQAGVEAVETTQFPNLQKIKTPLSDEKILVGLHQPITSSFRWLATLAMHILKQAHLGLKVVHGKVMRVQRK